MDNDKIQLRAKKKSAAKIEIDEDRLPGRWSMSISAGMVKKSWNATQWRFTVVSHCGGSVDGRFVTGKGIFQVELEGVPGSFLLENLGYTFGFIIVIMARQYYLPKIP